MEEIVYKLDNFDGPLDLLWHLIEKNKINIFDIPIVEITNQYMEFLVKSEVKDLNIMSSFLVIACNLLELKTKMLLPKKDDVSCDDIDPRSELVRKLLEYKKYKNLSLTLCDYEDDAPEYYLKKPTIPKEVVNYIPEINYDELFDGITIEKLNTIFLEVLRRKENSINQNTNLNLNVILTKEKISLKQTLFNMFEYIVKNKKFKFREYLETANSKQEVIVMFLSILELVKIGKIAVSQNNVNDDICIDCIDDTYENIDITNLEDA